MPEQINGAAAELETTLEWFGATTFRLTIGPLVFFLDTWLDRPSNIPKFLSTSDVKKCDYILISHAVSHKQPFYWLVSTPLM